MLALRVPCHSGSIWSGYSIDCCRSHDVTIGVVQFQDGRNVTMVTNAASELHVVWFQIAIVVDQDFCETDVGITLRI